MPLRLFLAAALLASSSFCAAALMQAVTPQGTGLGPVGAGGAPGAQSTPAQGFLSELSFLSGHIRALTLSPVTPETADVRPVVETNSRPEAALLFLTGVSAAAGQREEHEARQVLLEYMARSSLQDKVEDALLQGAASEPGAGEAVATLRALRTQLSGLDARERRVWLEGLAQLRRQLYTSTAKDAAIAGTEEHLARLFDKRRADGPGQAVSVPGGAGQGPNRPSLLKRARPVPEAEPGADAIEQDQRSARIIATVMKRVQEQHVDHPSLVRLLWGLAKRAGIDGVSEQGSAAETIERREDLSRLAGMIRRLGEAGPQRLDAAVNIAYSFIAGGLTPLIDDAALVAALKSVVAQTGDPFSGFLDPEEARAAREDREGGFGGIGIVADAAEGGLRVRQVTPGGPADMAGLAAGDAITAIDGEPARSASELDRIKGPVGTSVRLAVRRGEGGAAHRFELTLLRAQMESSDHPVFAKMLTGRPGTAYLKISDFDARVLRETTAALARLRAEGMKTLVLDVRYNPGGLVEQVGRVASLFLKRGQTVAYKVEMGLTSPLRRNAEDGRYADLPIVVLANEWSASAAEILTAALKDNGRGLFMGKTTWGKGIGQVSMEFMMGPLATVLRLTTFRWLTPLKRCIQGLVAGLGGVAPDVALEIDEAAEHAAARNMGKTVLTPQEWDPAADPWIMRAAGTLEQGTGTRTPWPPRPRAPA